MKNDHANQKPEETDPIVERPCTKVILQCTDCGADTPFSRSRVVVRDNLPHSICQSCFDLKHSEPVTTATCHDCGVMLTLKERCRIGPEDNVDYCSKCYDKALSRGVEKCPICDGTGTIPGAFLAHVRHECAECNGTGIAPSEPEFTCTACGAKWKQEASRLTRAFIKVSNKPILCDDCARAS